MKNTSFNRVAIFLVVLFCTVTISKVSAQHKVKAAVIAFYNLENLFDTIDDPTIDDSEFLPNGLNGWNASRYALKLKNMSEVISQIGNEFLPGGPTVLGVSEIENAGVLHDLIATPALLNSGYGVVHFNSPDFRGIDVGFLYKKKDFTIINATSTRLYLPSDSSWRTRDQLCVTGLLDGDPISIIVNHWPSRGNDEPYRLAAAALTKHIADSLYGLNPEAKIFIEGDLNDDPVDKSVLSVLGAKGKIKDVKKGGYFNPSWKLFKDGIGSLAYRDSWNLFDQIIVSEPIARADAAGWRLYKANVFKKPFLITKEGQYAGYPFRTFAGGAFAGGYSDHLPAYVVIVKEKQ